MSRSFYSIYPKLYSINSNFNLKPYRSICPCSIPCYCSLFRHKTRVIIRPDIKIRARNKEISSVSVPICPRIITDYSCISGSRCGRNCHFPSRSPIHYKNVGSFSCSTVYSDSSPRCQINCSTDMTKKIIIISGNIWIIGQELIVACCCRIGHKIKLFRQNITN